ncbi:hypothetical protein TMatcc_009545 [Talaromyces marneffei ATCC 18224]
MDKSVDPYQKDTWSSAAKTQHIETNSQILWSGIKEKFNNASIDEIRKDFKREMLVPEMGDDELNPDDDGITTARKYELYCQKREELAEELGQECLWGGRSMVFQSILNAPEPKEGMKIKWGEYEYIGFVKIVTTYERSLVNEHWPGWGKVDFKLLWWLYNDDEIEIWARSSLPEGEGVYELSVITGDL